MRGEGGARAINMEDCNGYSALAFAIQKGWAALASVGQPTYPASCFELFGSETLPDVAGKCFVQLERLTAAGVLQGCGGGGAAVPARRQRARPCRHGARHRHPTDSSNDCCQDSRGWPPDTLHPAPGGTRQPCHPCQGCTQGGGSTAHSTPLCLNSRAAQREPTILLSAPPSPLVFLLPAVLCCSTAQRWHMTT